MAQYSDAAHDYFEATFPALRQHCYSISSPRTPRYNCFAWAAGDTTQPWEPVRGHGGIYWPRRLQLGFDLETFTRLYEFDGYRTCAGGSKEERTEKVALYVREGTVTHAARQRPDGIWLSKMGTREDIEHSTVEALEGDEYGYVERYLSRVWRES